MAPDSRPVQEDGKFECWQLDVGRFSGGLSTNTGIPAIAGHVSSYVDLSRRPASAPLRLRLLQCGQSLLPDRGVVRFQANDGIVVPHRLRQLAEAPIQRGALLEALDVVHFQGDDGVEVLRTV